MPHISQKKLSEPNVVGLQGEKIKRKTNKKRKKERKKNSCIAWTWLFGYIRLGSIFFIDGEETETDTVERKREKGFHMFHFSQIFRVLAKGCPSPLSFFQHFHFVQAWLLFKSVHDQYKKSTCSQRRALPLEIQRMLFNITNIKVRIRARAHWFSAVRILSAKYNAPLSLSLFSFALHIQCIRQKEREREREREWRVA